MSPVSQARPGSRAARHPGRTPAGARPRVPRAATAARNPAPDTTVRAEPALVRPAQAGLTTETVRAGLAPDKTVRAGSALKKTARADLAPTTTAAHPAAEETS
ncbi:hypothetical protein [Streptomyces sp. NPDC127038]|uniref:hypothetical protein n=1 Tax=Streptomyces sp. NPDC127038 TaxID=3347114 RepID=UPI003669BF83